MGHSKLWKILKEMRIPDFLTCFLRNLYAGQEVTVRTGLGKTNNPIKNEPKTLADTSPKIYK